MQALLEADSRVIVWWCTPIECVSALAHLERDGALSADHFGMAQRRLGALEDL